ncbi:MAG: exosortase A-associated hydrolase 1 [Motiliproteus sp.]|jgi:exosortase A-associated hydrolase 1
MNREVALSFKNSQQQPLAGILNQPVDGNGVGVVIVVGGGQYRVGSHRQFVNLARFLSDRGVAVFRFDVTGMGDSCGVKKSFECLDEDIGAAIDVFIDQAEAVNKVILWGLCDGASAALLYAPLDARVAALVLINPWMEQPQAKARARLFSYYWERLLQRAFWHKVRALKFDLRGSMREFLQVLAGAMTRAGIKQPSENMPSYQERMYQAAFCFSNDIHVLLSGRDLIAREFELQFTAGRWQQVARREQVHLYTNNNADHTFSEPDSEHWLKETTLDVCAGYAR